jgi:hypothetical protein
MLAPQHAKSAAYPEAHDFFTKSTQWPVDLRCFIHAVTLERRARGQIEADRVGRVWHGTAIGDTMRRRDKRRIQLSYSTCYVRNGTTWISGLHLYKVFTSTILLRARQWGSWRCREIHSRNTLVHITQPI